MPLGYAGPTARDCTSYRVAAKLLRLHEYFSHAIRVTVYAVKVFSKFFFHHAGWAKPKLIRVSVWVWVGLGIRMQYPIQVGFGRLQTRPNPTLCHTYLWQEGPAKVLAY